MTARPEFEFVTVACRDPKVNNCPQVARNVPGVIALRDSERPGEIVTVSAEAWADVIAAEAVRLGLTA
ncbi:MULTISPECIES: DUF397 domain-containing protein [Kitasatospora]|uniref:DUF397 domain-containing protein n=1 Tax=Kitasatospora cystarginea TaxID=58350 RepID=A0ABN3DPD5_9ACTN